MKFGKSDKIQFISTVKGLESVEECLPRPAKHFIPQWFKDVPPKIGETATVRNCPSFPDYFSQGYIIPMWTDLKMKYKDEVADFQLSATRFTFSTHANEQMLDHKKPSFTGVEGQHIFKADCPWRIVTPPGWSVLQLPLFYHFNQEWSVLPGVIDTDIHSEINQQILYHGNGKEVKINCGDPLVLYIPFKRSNKLKHEIRYRTEEEYQKFDRHTLLLNQHFIPNGTYRKMQRERDKDV